MKAKIIFGLLLALSLGQEYLCPRGGGDAAIGGFFGGTAGGLLGGAIANRGSSDDGGRRTGKKALRAVDELEEEMRVDLKRFNRRLDAIENSVDELKQAPAVSDAKPVGGDTKGLEDRLTKLEASVAELTATLKGIKVTINDFDHRVNRVEDRVAILDKGPGSAASQKVVAAESVGQIVAPVNDVRPQNIPEDLSHKKQAQKPVYPELLHELE